jgi:hypothetical protein
MLKNNYTEIKKSLSFSSEITSIPIWPLQFSVIRFVFRVEADMPVGTVPSEVFRGALGIGLKTASCHRGQDCKVQCEAYIPCAYGYLFEGRHPKKNFLQLNQEVPRPFVIRASSSELHGIFRKDCVYAIELILFGDACNFVKECFEAFQVLAQQGMGLKERATFVFIKIESLTTNGRWQLLQASEILEKRNAPPLLTVQDILSWVGPVPDQVTLVFYTPLALKSDGQLVKKPTAGQLLRRLRDRASSLGKLYCSKTLENFDFKAFGNQADMLKSSWLSWEWKEGKRFSSHTKQFHPVTGALGMLKVDGNLAPFWGLLSLGQYVHVGRQTVLGHGGYYLKRN